MPEPTTYNGWDQPKAESPPTTKAPGNPRWPRGPQPFKKTVWPKSKDMKYVPSSSDSDGGVSFRSNSNGDPDYDIKKLTDWNGDWLPAPETWTGRKGHADRHFGAHIEKWWNTHPPECITPVYFPPDTFDAGKELVPRYWLQAKVEGETLREFWQTMLTTTSEPELIDKNDLVDYMPWWELYEDLVYEEIIEDEEGLSPKRITHESSYIHALKVPDARVNHYDEEYPSAPLDLVSTEEKVQEKNRRVEQKRNKTMAKRNRPVPESKLPVHPMIDRRLRPEANIYVRPIQASDVLGITVSRSC